MKKALWALLAVFLPLSAAAGTISGFVFVQGYGEKNGKSPDFTSERLRLWVKGVWGGHLDLDATKRQDEVRQLYATYTRGKSKFSVGRFLVADTWNTIPPHLLRAASGRQAEGTLGPFFANGFQYEYASGQWDLMADVGNAGQRFYRLGDTNHMASSLRLQYGEYGKRYASLGARTASGKRYFSLDSGYELANSYFAGSIYRATNTRTKRSLTGVGYIEYRPWKYLAPHILRDVPPLGNPITSVGVGVGDLKHAYLAVDRQFGRHTTRFAARATIRLNF